MRNLSLERPVQIANYIQFEAAIGYRLTKKQLTKRLEHLSLEDCLQSAGKLSYLLANDRHVQADDLVAGIFRDDPIVSARIAARRLAGHRIVFTQRLLAFAR